MPDPNQLTKVLAGITVGLFTTYYFMKEALFDPSAFFFCSSQSSACQTLTLAAEFFLTFGVIIGAILALGIKEPEDTRIDERNYGYNFNYNPI